MNNKRLKPHKRLNAAFFVIIGGMKCVFEKEKGYFRCCNCGFRSQNIIDRNCEVETYPVIRFAKEVGRYIQSGFRNVHDDEYQKRLNICKDCEHFDKGRCLLCGCWMRIKAKGKVFRCKKDKWDD